MSGELSTADRILFNAVTLISEKGFKGVTVKEIASASSVSEMTVFRYFGTKRRILDEAINKYHYSAPMENIFNEKIIWNLEDDLTVISRAYHEIMKKNQELVFIAIKEQHTIPGVDVHMAKHPRRLVELLVNYLTKMQDSGKVIPENPEALAVHFLWMNFGAFLSNKISGQEVTQISLEQFINTSVRTFARGITPGILKEKMLVITN